MANSTSFVIIGGGLAAAKAVEALRDNDFDGHIIVFADEEHRPTSGRRCRRSIWPAKSR